MNNCSAKTHTIIVTNSTLQDESIRYSINYQQIDGQPKLYAVILDPTTRWSKEPIVSLEYRSLAETSLQPIYSSLKLINAAYENRTISYLKNGEIILEIVRITSNSIQAVAYLSHIYSESSCEAGLLLQAPLASMVKWMLNMNSPSLFQDFGIWMAHLSEEARYYNAQSRHDDQCSEMEPLTNEESELRLNEKIYRVTNRFKQMPNEDKNTLFYRSINFIISKKVEQIIEDASIEKIQEMLGKAEFEKAQLAFSKVKLVFQDLAQCSSFLESKHPDTRKSVEQLTKFTQDELSSIDTPMINLENFTKNTKDGTTFFGTLIFDFLLKNIDSVDSINAYVPPIGYTLSLIKISTCTLSLFLRNNWFNFSDKESSKKINKNDLAKEFVCKYSICTIGKFGSLADDSLILLAKFFAKVIHYATNNDNNQYPSQSYFIDAVLEKISNTTYLTSAKSNYMLSTELTTKDNNITISLGDYIGAYNQTECYNDIQNKLVGEIAEG